MKQDWKHNIYLHAFVLNFIIAAITIIPYVILGHGRFGMANDFNAEIIPYGMFINEAYKKGEILWNFNIDLGSNFLESLGGYNSTPFLLISALFPARMFPYVLPWMIMLKIAAAGATSALFFNRFIKAHQMILMASVLYSFSGFQCINIVFQFEDLLVLFPLMLYGLEVLMHEGRISVFILGCGLNAMISTAGFVGNVIFIVVYFVARFLIPAITERNCTALMNVVKKAVLCLLCGCIGVGLASVFIIPGVVNLVGNPRVSGKLPREEWFHIGLPGILRYIKGFFLPPEPMNSNFTLDWIYWMSNSAYLPLFGSSLTIAYLLKKGMNWLKGVIAFFLIVALVPLLNNSFYLFTAEQYRRWYYMLTLLLSLAAGIVMENHKDYPIKAGVGISLIVIAFFVFCIHHVQINGNEIPIFYMMRYKLAVAFAVCGLITVVLLTSDKLLLYKKIHIFSGRRGELGHHSLVLLISAVFCFIQLGTIIHYYQTVVDDTGINFNEFGRSYSDAAVAYVTETAENFKPDIGPYRYYFDEGIGCTYYNLGMTAYLPTTNSFISTLSNSVFEFYKAIGIGRYTRTLRGPLGTDSLLGERYIVTRDYYGEDYVFNFRNSNQQEFLVYENRLALPIGFAYDTYMTRSEYDAIDRSLKSVAMIAALVIKDEDESVVKHTLEHYNPHIHMTISEENYPSLVEEKLRHTCKRFVRGRNFFGATVRTKDDRYVFFSIPYERWWDASVNGVSEPVINVNGLMAVKVPAGNSTIVFVYDYKPFKYALIITIFSSIICLVCCIYERLSNSRPPSEKER